MDLRNELICETAKRKHSTTVHVLKKAAFLLSKYENQRK